MSISNIYKTLSFFSPPEKLELVSFFARRKFNKSANFLGSSKTIDRYNKVVKIFEHDIDVKIISSNVVQLSFTINNKKYVANIRPLTSDIEVFISVILGEEYKSAVSLPSHANAKEIIIDAGANIGFTTLYFHAHNPACRFLCIEPDPNNHELLKTNLSLNNISNAEIINKAIWTKKETLQLHSEFRDGEAWSKSVVPSSAKSKDAYSVDSCTMEEILNKYPDHSIEMFKIDIEGAEEFLFSSEEFIQQIDEYVPRLIIEIHDEADIRKTIYETMRERKYSISEFDDVTLFAKN